MGAGGRGVGKVDMKGCCHTTLWCVAAWLVMPIGCFFGAWGSCVAAGEEVCGCGMLELFQRGADLPRECMEKSGLKV